MRAVQVAGGVRAVQERRRAQGQAQCSIGMLSVGLSSCHDGSREEVAAVCGSGPVVTICACARKHVQSRMQGCRASDSAHNNMKMPQEERWLTGTASMALEAQ